MNLILHIASLLIFLSYLTPAYAKAPTPAKGFYLGGDLTFISYVPVDGSSTNSSLGPSADYVRPFIGYRFDEYLAVEAGYNDFVNNRYNGGDYNGLGTLGGNHYKLYAIDCEGVLSYPLNAYFSLYGKAGLAYTYQNVYSQSYVGLPPTVDTTAHRFLPLFGLGLSYHFTHNLSSNLSFTHLQGVSPIGHVEILGLGLSYTLDHNNPLQRSLSKMLV